MLLPLALVIVAGFLTLPAYAQVPIQVNQTAPCFMNLTAGADMLRNCGAEDDWLAFTLVGWQWMTGGNFSMILVSVFVVMSYIKYHKAVYPLLIGIIFMPISYFVFPEVFLNWAIIMAILACGFIVTFIFLRQTKEW